MKKTMKKTLAIILAILMIASTMPMVFAEDVAVVIEHQPTSSEPYVELNSEVEATYQWKKLNKGTEITDETAESVSYGVEASSYSAETGWTASVWANGIAGNHFSVSLEKGQKITFEFDDMVYAIGIWNDDLNKGAYVYNVNGGFVTFEAPETADYYTYYYGPTVFNLRAYIGGNEYVSLETETEATLQAPELGATYICNVAIDGETLVSDSFEYGYAITQQPTIEKPVVELNDDTDATYQWKIATDEAIIELTDERANPAAHTEKTTYDEENGWTGDFWEDGTGAYFLGINLKKDEKLYVDFGKALSGEIGIWDNSLKDGVIVEDGTENGEIEFTAPWDGYFELYAYGISKDTRAKAYIDGYFYEDVEGATENSYAPTDEALYVCEVTFKDGSTEVSYMIEGPHTHNYTSEVVAPTCTGKGATIKTCACGHKIEEEILALGHTEVVDEAKDATCTETGLKEGKHCSVCNEVLTEQEVVPALGHDTVTDEAKAPTCTETGLTAGSHCSRCDEKVEQEVIPALGHDIVIDAAKAPTCTETGLTEGSHCSRCDGATVPQEVVPVTSHNYESVVTAPTCTEKGYTTYTCSGCGDTYTDNEVDATNHTGKDAVEENRVNATCTADGSVDKVVYCRDCNTELSRTKETLLKTGHKIVKVDAKAPTCTETGYEAHEYCSACDYTTIKEIAATGHTIVKVDAKAPDCTEIGYEAHEYCSVCDYTTYVEISALGHDWDEGVLTRPTDTENGYYTHTCKRDNTHTKKEDAGKANYTEFDKAYKKLMVYLASDQITAAGKDEISMALKNCAASNDHMYATGAIDRDLIANEQEYVDNATTALNGVIAMVEAQALRCESGKHDVRNFAPETEADCTKAATKKGTCYYCGEEVIVDDETSPALGHKEVVDEAKAATCTETGLTEGKHCSVCSNVLVEQEEIKALGHDIVIDEAKAPTCTETGLTEGKHCSRCDAEKVEQEVVPVIGHNYEAVVTEPTCTEKGYTTHTCSGCKDVYTGNEVDALGHTEKEAVEENRVEATCTEDGSVDKVVYCETCEEELSRKTESIPAKKHNSVSTITAPTCTEKGYTKHVCSVCGYENIDSFVAALGHDVVVDEAKEPTCTETGLKEGSHCSRCDGATVKQEVIPATGHNYETVVTEPTCEVKGSTTYTCSVCDDTYTEEIPVLGHDWGDGVLTRPGEVGIGYYTYTCKRDNTHTRIEDAGRADYTEFDKAYNKYNTYLDSSYITESGKNEIKVAIKTCASTNPHMNANGDIDRDLIASEQSYVDEATTAINGVIAMIESQISHCTNGQHDVRNFVSEAQPTCTESGTKKGTCYYCGTEVVEEDENAPALGHDEVVDEAKAATCTETGLTEGKHCSVCEAVITAQEETPALGHDIVIDEAKAPTCTETGLTEGKHCSRCDAEKIEQEVVPVTGHSYESTVTAPTCTEKGYTTYTCSVCEDTYTDDEVEALGHDMITDEAKAPTCTETGLTAGAHCSRCDEKVVQEEVPATGHKYESVVTEPTCTEKGYTTYTCSVCEDTYTDDEVAALGHTPAEVVEENYVAPTCSEIGSKDIVVYCSECDEEISRETVEIEILDHADEDNNGICDDCEVQFCDHACHATGFRKIIYVIVLFFQKYLGTNQYCECGAAHY